jgi:hypothetical protein
MSMSIARELSIVLAPHLGRAEETIHTAIPPIHLGGGADVLEFRNSKWPGGVVYVSAGASAHGRSEIAICTREPQREFPRLLSRLAAASLKTPFVDGGTVPLGDGPWAGLLFTSHPTVPDVLFAMGTTQRELAVCRSLGVACVVKLLEQAGVFPWSDPGRLDVLSDGGHEGLLAVVEEQFDQIDHLVGALVAEDVPILAKCYDDLRSFEQRTLLIELLQHHGGPSLHPLWRAYLRDALGGKVTSNGLGHIALVMAVCGLEENEDSFDQRYWNDLDAALQRAGELLA